MDTYNNGYAANIGVLDGSGSYLCEVSGSLVLVSEINGQEKSSSIKLEGNTLSSNVLSKVENTGSSESYYDQFEKLKVIFCNAERPWGNSFELLNNLFSDSAGSNNKESDIFTQTDIGFTDQKTTVASLPNGWIAVINAEKSRVVSAFRLDGEEIEVVGVTKEAIYIQSVNTYISDGRPVITVTAYDYSGSKKATLDSYNKIWFEEGHLIMQYTREYPWPSRTCVIDHKDQIVIEHDGLWDAGVYNGEVYYLLPADYSGKGSSQIEIYKISSNGDKHCGSISMYVDEDSTVYPYLEGDTIFVQTERLDDSADNWEDWEVIITKKAYSLNGTPCEARN